MKTEFRFLLPLRRLILPQSEIPDLFRKLVVAVQPIFGKGPASDRLKNRASPDVETSVQLGPIREQEPRWHSTSAWSGRNADVERLSGLASFLS